VAFFCSVLSPNATRPNAVLNLAYVGAVVLATAVVTLGISLLRGATGSGQVSRVRFQQRTRVSLLLSALYSQSAGSSIRSTRSG
jgi:hypothetical protein